MAKLNSTDSAMVRGPPVAFSHRHVSSEGRKGSWGGGYPWVGRGGSPEAKQQGRVTRWDGPRGWAGAGYSKQQDLYPSPSLNVGFQSKQDERPRGGEGQTKPGCTATTMIC